jgi:hypothetical protein
MMNKESANRIKMHVLGSIREISSALVVAQEECSNDEFVAIRALVGDITARLDNLLRTSVYAQFPELDDL